MPSVALTKILLQLQSLLVKLRMLDTKRFALDEMKVGGYDYGVKTSYTPHHLGVDWHAVRVPLFAPSKGIIFDVYTGHEGGLTILFRPYGETTLIRWLHLS